MIPSNFIYICSKSREEKLDHILYVIVKEWYVSIITTFALSPFLQAGTMINILKNKPFNTTLFLL
jgi:hypothetical protein